MGGDAFATFFFFACFSFFFLFGSTFFGLGLACESFFFFDVDEAGFNGFFAFDFLDHLGLVFAQFFVSLLFLEEQHFAVDALLDFFAFFAQYFFFFGELSGFILFTLLFFGSLARIVQNGVKEAFGAFFVGTFSISSTFYSGHTSARRGSRQFIKAVTQIRFNWHIFTPSCLAKK